MKLHFKKTVEKEFFQEKKKVRSGEEGGGRGGGVAGRVRERRKSRQSGASVRRACVIAVTSSLRVRRLFPVCSEGRR